jgi:hypothetical protein
MTAPAIALDEFLTKATDADWAAMRKAAPAHLLDQHDAAATEALNATMTEMALFHGAKEITWARHRDVPEWIRLSVLDTVTRFFAGRADTCMHQPSADHPEPVLAAAWRPGLVTCTDCAHLFRLAGDADRRCDRCGRVCAGLPGDGIHACRVMFGPLVYAYGLCVGCMADFTEATS